MIETKPFDVFAGTIKRSQGGKLVAEVRCDDMAYYPKSYPGKTVQVGEELVKVASTGSPFGDHGDMRIYLYLDAPAVKADNGWCNRCQSYCYGDCRG